jgi:hypothetical protein
MKKVYNKTINNSYIVMDTYNVIFNEEENEGVYAISLVSDPAIGVQFLALAKQTELKLATVNEEQRILVGAILIPEQLIYRNQDGNEYNIKFTAETIKQVHRNFVKQGYQNNSTIEHSGMQIEDVTFVETWIKEDEVHDKSVLYGFSEKVGTMFGLMKVNNDEIWNDYVKTGKVKGFSIDGVFDMEKVNLKSDYNMNLETIVNAIKEGFASVKLSQEVATVEEVEVTLETMKLKDGVTILEAEIFEAGQPVFIVAENDERVPAPIGDHELEDGRILVITEEGVIAEIKEAMAEEETQEVETEMSKEDQFSELVKSIVTSMSIEVAKQIESVKTELSAQIAEVKTAQIEVKASTKAKPEVKETSNKNVKLTRNQKILNNIKNLN